MIQDENKTKFRRCAKFLSSLTPFCKYILLLWDSITFYAWKTILANIFKRKTCSIRKIIILIKIGKALSFCCIKESYSPMLSVETLNVGFIHYISLLMELEYIATVFKCYRIFIITDKIWKIGVILFFDCHRYYVLNPNYLK